MAEKKRKKVIVSEQFTEDVKAVFSYGEELFGTVAARSFVTDLYNKLHRLDREWELNPECRHLPTKDQRYRNIVLGKYLIIYRVRESDILVLRILHGRSSITKIKSSRSIK